MGRAGRSLVRGDAPRCSRPRLDPVSACPGFPRSPGFHGSRRAKPDGETGPGRHRVERHPELFPRGAPGGTPRGVPRGSPKAPCTLLSWLQAVPAGRKPPRKRSRTRRRKRPWKRQCKLRISTPRRGALQCGCKPDGGGTDAAASARSGGLVRCPIGVPTRLGACPARLRPQPRASPPRRRRGVPTPSSPPHGPTERERDPRPRPPPAGSERDPLPR